MTIQRMDNVLIVVDDLESVISFFVELGMELEGKGPIEGRWVEQVIGIDDVRQDVAMLRTPDGHGRIELAMFHTPKAITPEPKDAPANTLGIRRVMFAVDDIEDVVARLFTHGANSSASWRSTRTCIDSATSAAPRASSSDWPNSSAEGQHHADRRSATSEPSSPWVRPPCRDMFFLAAAIFAGVPGGTTPFETELWHSWAISSVPLFSWRHATGPAPTPGSRRRTGARPEVNGTGSSPLHHVVVPRCRV